jgi:hypothetical protein
MSTPQEITDAIAKIRAAAEHCPGRELPPMEQDDAYAAWTLGLGTAAVSDLVSFSVNTDLE